MSKELVEVGPVPEGARGIAILKHTDGSTYERIVENDEVILNLERQLIDHLNDSACTDAFLHRLADYCRRRIESRRAALSSGHISIVGPDANWHLI